MVKVMSLKDYIMEVEANTDIRFSNDILKMNLKYLFTEQMAVLDGNHIRLSELSIVDMKRISINVENNVIMRKATVYNYEYEPELQEKYSHIYVYISPEESQQWINQL